MKYLALGLFFTIFLTNCNRQEDKRTPIASAYDYMLYTEDLVEMLPKNLSQKDSVQFARNFINQWQHSMVELHHAELNLNQENYDFSRQIEDYRNSLLVYEYEKRLVEHRLDTLVSDDEVQAYYDIHIDDFTLKRNIVQAIFLKIDREDTKNIDQIKKLLSVYKEEDKIKLKDIAEYAASNYFLDDDIWLFFDDLTNEIPITTYNQVSFLRNNRIVVEQDSLFTYLLRINDFKIADSFSPIEFEYDRIRSIIINIRKLDLIERMQREIFEDAQAKGEVEINQ